MRGNFVDLFSQATSNAITTGPSDQFCDSRSITLEPIKKKNDVKIIATSSHKFMDGDDFLPSFLVEMQICVFETVDSHYK